MESTYCWQMMLAKDNEETVSEELKLGFVQEVLRDRCNVSVALDDRMVKEIADLIGSMWDDVPMPVASEDLPQMVEDFYHELAK